MYGTKNKRIYVKRRSTYHICSSIHLDFTAIETGTSALYNRYSADHCCKSRKYDDSDRKSTKSLSIHKIRTFHREFSPSDVAIYYSLRSDAGDFHLVSLPQRRLLRTCSNQKNYIKHTAVDLLFRSIYPVSF